MRHAAHRLSTAGGAIAAQAICLLGLLLSGGHPAQAGYEATVLEGGTYDREVPRPSDVLGWEIGTWHVRHDQLVRYAEAVADASPRVSLTYTGRTHEDRPLLLLAVTSEANQERLDDLRTRHVAALRGGAPSEGPLIVWMGYSVHGNEASGSNASLLLLYHLAASQDPQVARWLDDMVVLIDPSLNPDGLARFAQWVNAHRGAQLVGDRNHREHREGWPNGRTNHYWFDLNRDWLPLVHPESRARLEQFHRWMPNVLTDFHEMGTDATYFFQPGVPSRKNPMTPEENVTLTSRIADFHARALDAKGRLYYTEESFDDFYYGKGSTYPDVNGGIGILFEQASSRGHLSDSNRGPLPLTKAIDNQWTTSLSTLEASWDLREDLLDYQRRFYADAPRAARGAEAGWIFTAPENPERVADFLDLMRRHAVQVHPVGRGVEIDGKTFAAGESWMVTLDQPQARLVRAMFEQRTEFEDSTFYDVSAWTLPLAFGLQFAPLSAEQVRRPEPGALVVEVEYPTGELVGESAVGWAFDWAPDGAPRALQFLHDAGHRTTVATRPFTGSVGGVERRFRRGTIVVPRGEEGPDELIRDLRKAAEIGRLRIEGLDSGRTTAGIDLGSPSQRVLDAPRPLLVVGPGTSTYETGEQWFVADRRLGLKLPLVEASTLSRIRLADYTHLLLASGRYDWDDTTKDRIRSWLRQGGTIVATKSATAWLSRAEIAPVAPLESATRGRGERTQDGDSEDEDGDGEDAEEPESVEARPYADMRGDAATERVAGTVFEVALDLTHPLAYGYRRDRIATFRNSRAGLKPSSNPYGTPARYVAEPLLAGYASTENRERLAGSALAVVERVGGGTVVALADDPVFRGFWRATERLWVNAIYFSGVVDSPPRGDDAVDGEGGLGDH